MSAPSFKTTLPIKIVSVANLREHWSVRAKRAQNHRYTAKMLCSSAKIIPLPLTVFLTRVGSRKMDDDNCIGGFKATRDGIADALGHPDNHPEIKWVYAQIPGKVACVNVEIVGV